MVNSHAILIAFATAAVLAVEHVALYPRPLRLSRPLAFVLGTLTIGGGFSVWCWLNPQAPALVALVAFWVITGIGGLTVAVLYLLRVADIKMRLARVSTRALLEGRDGYREG